MINRDECNAAPDAINEKHFDARLPRVLTVAFGDLVRVRSVNEVRDVPERGLFNPPAAESSHAQAHHA
jgi:hypothetical protein